MTPTKNIEEIRTGKVSWFEIRENPSNAFRSLCDRIGLDEHLKDFYFPKNKKVLKESVRLFVQNRNMVFRYDFENMEYLVYYKPNGFFTKQQQLMFIGTLVDPCEECAKAKKRSFFCTLHKKAHHKKAQEYQEFVGVEDLKEIGKGIRNYWFEEGGKDEWGNKV